MSITNELREIAKKNLLGPIDYGKEGFTKIGYKELTAIADRIDEQHRRGMAAAQQVGYNEGEDVAMREGWVKLPVDADGVSIHVGDTVAIFDHKEVHAVETIELTSRGWFVVAGEHTCISTNLHHVQPDSWERIIAEAMRFARNTDVPYPEVEDVGKELIERCKRLAGDAE